MPATNPLMTIRCRNNGCQYQCNLKCNFCTTFMVLMIHIFCAPPSLIYQYAIKSDRFQKLKTAHARLFSRPAMTFFVRNSTQFVIPKKFFKIPHKTKTLHKNKPLKQIHFFHRRKTSLFNSARFHLSSEKIRDISPVDLKR